MKLSNRILSLLSCAAVLTVAPVAHAATVNGYYWDAAHSGVTPCSGPGGVGSCSGSQGFIPASLPSSGTAVSTFTLSNPNGPALINFFSNTDLGLTGFLTTGQNGLTNNDVLTYLTGASHGTDNINDALFLFTGSTTLTAGTTYNILHDDGVELFLNGSSTCTVCAGAPTSAADSTFTVATSGVYTFNLWYTEVNGSPAILQSDIIPAPEPNSLMLLGTGVLGAAGMLRRRLRA